MKDPFLYAHTHDVVWLSQNTNHLPTSPEIEKAMLDAIKNKEYNKYPYKSGILGLNDAIRKDLKLDKTWEVLPTAGCIEALYIANRALLKKGDEVIATDPSFFPIHHQIELSGAKPIEIPVYKKPSRMTLSEINERITKKTRIKVKKVIHINELNTN